jgi:hypothetical protein
MVRGRRLFLVVAVPAYAVYAGVLLGPGDTYTYPFTSLQDVAAISPDLPAYDDYTFELHFSGILYSKPPDDIRIRLFEDLEGSVPVHEIFGESVPNLSVSPSRIRMYRVPGTLWFDRTGRIEVEVIAGSVNVDHLFIDLGPGQASYSSYIEAVPEPGSATLLLLGAAALIQHVRARRGRTKERIKPLIPRPEALPADLF